jgi:hypothetical protein
MCRIPEIVTVEGLELLQIVEPNADMLAIMRLYLEKLENLMQELNLLYRLQVLLLCLTLVKNLV